MHRRNTTTVILSHPVVYMIATTILMSHSPKLDKKMDLPELYLLFLALISIIVISSLLKSLLSAHDNLTTPPPSPPSLPILGHLHLFNLTRGSLHLNLQSLSAQYGPTLLLRLGTRRLLLLSSATSVEKCFSQNDVVFANRPEALAFHITGYNSSAIGAAPYGDHWRNLRRVSAIHIFSAACIRRTAAVRNTQVQQMIQTLTRSSDPTPQKVKVNLNTLFSKLALHVAGLMVAGKSCDHIGDIFRPLGLLNVCDFVSVLRCIGYKGFERNLKKAQRKRDEFLQGLINEFRREKVGTSPEKKMGVGGKTILEALMGLQAAEPAIYTDDIIKGMIMLMFTAGKDTTVKTMEWAMALLLNHPKILAKAREELDKVIKPGHLIDDSDVPNLLYLRCIINETLRLFPVAPLLVPHCSSSECIVNGYNVPKNTILMVNAWAVHRDEAMWDEPDEFRPERFEGFEGERDGYKFIPFGVGRRSCPGAALGMRFMGLGLGALIQCFEWETVEGGTEDLSQGNGGITLPKGKPLEAIYTVRNSMSSFLPQL